MVSKSSSFVLFVSLLAVFLAYNPHFPFKWADYLLDRLNGVDPSTNWALNNNFAPVKDEIFVQDLVVTYGEVPSDLEGIYIRNGPNPQLPETAYHWFDGDGMLHAIRIKNGKLNYTNSWVKTIRLQEEKAAQRPLYVRLGAMNGKTALVKMFLEYVQKKIGLLSGTGCTANTAVVYHNNHLLALVESSLPYIVKISENGQLSTISNTDFNGKWNYPVSAHSKVDPETGNLIIFGYSRSPPYCRHGVVDKQGNLIHSLDINIPAPVMMHDFALTEHYSIIMDLPLVFKGENLVRDKHVFEFNSTRASRFGILRHDETSEKNIKWFTAKPCWIFHVCNAWEEGDEVVLVVSRFDNFSLDLNNTDLQEQVWRYRFNMKTGATRESLLFDKNWDFPIIHPGFLGRKTNYAYHAIFDKIRTIGVSKVDLESKTILSEYLYGAGKTGGENIFVPKKGGTSEDDGYLLTFVYDENNNRSAFWIIDAKTMTQTAVVDLPQRVPFGFHGIFIDEENLSK